MNINDVGYNVTIGEPVVDANGVADSGLSFPCKAIPDGDYLVTLEVNGTVIAGRDKATFASGSATVGDYTLSYSSYAVSVATLTDDDVVVLRIEPLDVKVSDAFRAVVGKAAPAAGGGSPMTFYSTTSNNAQLKKGSSSGSDTGKDEWDAIIEAMDNGLPVMVKIGNFSYPVIALYSAVSIETAYDKENKVVITGFGNSGTTTQTRMVWKKPKNNTEDA